MTAYSGIIWFNLDPKLMTEPPSEQPSGVLWLGIDPAIYWQYEEDAEEETITHNATFFGMNF
jgi:hypothetical protein